MKVFSLISILLVSLSSISSLRRTLSDNISTSTVVSDKVDCSKLLTPADCNNTIELGQIHYKECYWNWDSEASHDENAEIPLKQGCYKRQDPYNKESEN